MHVHSTLCPNGDLLLTSMYLPGIHAYPMHLLRMYLEHENHLRELTKGGKTFDFEARPIPAGIDTFVSIWSEDTHCLYGFSALDPSSGVISPAERPPPPAELLYPALLREEAERNLLKVAREDRILLERLKSDAALRESERAARSRRSYESREARRQGKARAGMITPAMRKVTAAVANSLDLRHQGGSLHTTAHGAPSGPSSPASGTLIPQPDLSASDLLGVDFTREVTPGATGVEQDFPMLVGNGLPASPTTD